MAEVGRPEGHAAAHNADIDLDDAGGDVSSAAYGVSEDSRKHISVGCIPGVVFGFVLAYAVDES